MDEKKILYILSEIFEEIKDDPVDVSGITRETSFGDDLEIDSLQTAEMLVEIEERFGVTIMDEEAPKLRTVGDVVELILQKHRKRQPED